jgi:hypothetical protein
MTLVAYADCGGYRPKPARRLPWYASNGINLEGLRFPHEARERSSRGGDPGRDPHSRARPRYATNGINLEGLRFRATRGSAPSRRARGAEGEDQPGVSRPS